jgi:hypothetical protein
VISGGGALVADGNHLTLAYSQTALRLSGDAGAVPTSYGSFHSAILWRNAENVVIEGAFTFELTYSDVVGGVPPSGEGNIAADPLFVDPHLGDFSLSPGSPSIRSGKDGSDMGARIGTIETRPEFVRGDLDADGAINITDPVVLLGFMFLGQKAPACLDAADGDDSGKLEITDAVFILNFLFRGGPAMPPPYPARGADPTDDALGCGS